jgi:hypothetical protein
MEFGTITFSTSCQLRNEEQIWYQSQLLYSRRYLIPYQKESSFNELLTSSRYEVKQYHLQSKIFVYHGLATTNQLVAFV